MRATGLAIALLALPAAAEVPERYIDVTAPRPMTVAPGKSVTASLQVRVKEGFHVQANPASQPQLIATTVELEGKDDIQPGAVTYPPGKPYRLQGSTMEIASYDGSFELRIPLSVKTGAKTGRRKVEGNVRYQACNEKTCFPPRRERFLFTINVR